MAIVSPSVVDGLACPACGAESLTATPETVSCGGCGRESAVVAGVPDLRVSYDDPYVDWAEDVARARELEAHLADMDFLGLLRLHWRRSGKPEELAERFLAGDLVSAGRSEAYLAEIERRRGALSADDRFLEVGCGTGGMAAAASGRAGVVVASDISMRWLVLARKRLSDLGHEDVRLVCCSAHEPPFAPGFFDVVAASDVVEHAMPQPGFVAGCARILRDGGMLFLATPNRFSLGLEPHVRLWGVGWLPRRLAPRYVRALRDAPYDHVRLLSARELRRLLRAHDLTAELVAPEIPAATQQIYDGVELRLVRLYNRARRLRLVRAALNLVGPFFHVFARKGAS